MKLPKLLVVCIALVLLLQAPMSASAKTFMPQVVPTATISLTAPVPAISAVGGDVGIDLVINVANVVPGVAGADVYVGYNPALVTPPTGPDGAAEVLPGFFGSTTVSIVEVLPAAQCPGGASPCVHLVVAGPAQITKNGVAARFHFRGIAPGSACFTILQSSLSDADGYMVDHTAGAQQCSTIQTRTVSGIVLRQGVPANPNTGGGTLACASVRAVGSWTFGPVNTDTTGRFNLNNLPTDSYAFRATYPGYLAAEKTGVVVTNSTLTLDFGSVTLLGGDVNGDNSINILDIGAIISKFGRTGVGVRSASVNCSVTDEPADINDDGVVNISDLAIAAGNWGSVGPRNWP